MTEKRIIIHTGPFKTGSSAIQYWLSKNRDTLDSLGVYYPVHNIDKNSISSGNLLSICNYEEGVLSVSHDKANTLLEEFENSNANILLLSSEYFFSCIEELSEVFPSSEFVVYVREPLELANSTYNQSVKRAGNTKEFNVDFETSINVINKLSRINMPGKIKVLAYQSWDENWDITKSMFESVGLGSIHSKMVPLDEKVNLSYSFECLEFKRYFNDFLSKEEQSKLDKVLQSCHFGYRNYTLLQPKVYEDWVENIKYKLDGLTKIYLDSDLQSLMSYLDLESNCRYLPQGVNIKHIIDRVGRYIYISDYETYLILKDKGMNYNHTMFSNTIFDTSIDDDDLKIKTMNRILSGVKSEVYCEPGDIARELALYFEESGQLFESLSFIQLAAKLKPQGKIIKEHSIRISENIKF